MLLEFNINNCYGIIKIPLINKKCPLKYLSNDKPKKIRFLLGI